MPVELAPHKSLCTLTQVLCGHMADFRKKRRQSGGAASDSRRSKIIESCRACAQFGLDSNANLSSVALMRITKTISVARAPAAGLAMVGVFWGGFASLMPDIKAYAGASDAAFGLIMMLSAAGSMASMSVSSNLYDRAGRLTLPLVGLALSFAFLGPIWASDLYRLSAVVLVMGACVGMMDITSNIRTSAIEADEGISLMNYAHAMFSFAFGFTALGVGMAREAGYGPAEILPVLALVAVGLLLLTFEGPARWQAKEEPPDGEDGKLTGISLTVALLTAVVLFSSFVGENSTEAWSALHIERTLGAEVGHGSYGPAVLGIVMGIVRLMGQVLADRLGERNLIIASAALGATGAVVIAVAWTPQIVLWGVAVVAIGMAVIVPSANTVLGRRVPGHIRGKALSRAWMFGMTGFFVGPSVMGLISEVTSLRVSYGVIAIVIAATIPAVIALGRIPRVDK